MLYLNSRLKLIIYYKVVNSLIDKKVIEVPWVIANKNKSCSSSYNEELFDEKKFKIVWEFFKSKLIKL